MWLYIVFDRIARRSELYQLLFVILTGWPSWIQITAPIEIVQAASCHRRPGRCRVGGWRGDPAVGWGVAVGDHCIARFTVPGRVDHGARPQVRGKRRSWRGVGPGGGRPMPPRGVSGKVGWGAGGWTCISGPQKPAARRCVGVQQVDEDSKVVEGGCFRLHRNGRASSLRHTPYVIAGVLRPCLRAGVATVLGGAGVGSGRGRAGGCRSAPARVTRGL